MNYTKNQINRHMSETEINKAIAEACDLEVIDLPFNAPNQINPKGKVFTRAAAVEWRRIYPRGMGVLTIQDYCGNLDAIAKVINTKLTAAQYVNWCFNLEEICGGHAVAYNATARQRSEAFLKTIGIWKE